MPSRDLFKGMQEFLVLGQTKNFRRAAEILGVTPSAVGSTIRQVEARLGVPLFHRTTRRVEFTPAGQLLFDRFLPVLGALEETMQELGEFRDAESGMLRICVQSLALEDVLHPVLPVFRERFPDVALEIEQREGPADLLRLGFDVGIRLDDYIEPEMVAYPIPHPVEWVVAASTAYLDRHGRPQTPSDLLSHRCIRRRWINSDQHYRWQFALEGRTITVDPPSMLTVSDFTTLVAMVGAGEGLGYITRSMVAQLSEKLAVEEVLGTYMPSPDRMYAYYSPATRGIRRVRAFIETLRQVITLRDP